MTALRATLLGLSPLLAFGQEQPRVHEVRVELSAPFGSIPGRLIAAGEQLVFLDEGQRDASFYVPARNIQEVTADGAMLTVQLRTPVRDRSGERTRLSFRVVDPTLASAIGAWFHRVPIDTQAGSAARSAAGASSYEARHKKRFGGSRGRLLITATGLAYESVDDVEDSRRWAYRDIKELKLNNPYELEVVPFSGDKYTFGIEGTGMNTADYRQLVDEVTRARAGR